MRYGIDKCHYCLQNGVPIKLPGAVSLNIDDGAEFITKKIYKGGIIVEVVVGIQQAASKAVLTIAELPKQFLVDVFGYEIDSSGVLIEHQMQRAEEFSLLFETSLTNGNKRRHAYFHCFARKPSFETSTVEDAVKLSANSLDMIITGDPVSASISSSTNATIYNNWFNSVYK